jgi:PEP-CTERM motif
MKQSQSSTVRLVGTFVVAAVLAGAIALPRGAAALPVVHDVPATSLADDPSLEGTIVQEGSSPFDFVAQRTHLPTGNVRSGEVRGSLLTRVVRTANGSHDFYWRIFVDPESFIGVVEFRLSGFNSFVSQAGWRTDLPFGQEPLLWFTEGNELSFLFRTDIESSVLPGARSSYFYLRSTAREVARSAAAVVLANDSALRYLVTGHAAGISTYSPLSAVPEPQTWALMLLGLVPLAGWARWRQRHA